MNAPTLIILIIIIALAIIAVIFTRRNKGKNGCSNYGNNSCARCSNVDCPLKDSSKLNRNIQDNNP